MALILAYDKNDAGRVVWDDSAPLPDSLTLAKPGDYDSFNFTTGAWAFDLEKWRSAMVRPTRNDLLDAADQRVRRYDYRVRAGLPPKESAEKINELLQYMQVLRDLPNNENLTPENLTWPEVP